MAETAGTQMCFDQLKTPNGYHWITNRFDRREFSQKLIINKIEEVTIKDNSPTLLYYKMK